MSAEIEKLTEAYLERVKRPMTWSGIPLKEMYKPEDIKDLDYPKYLGDAGEYPTPAGYIPTCIGDASGLPEKSAGLARRLTPTSGSSSRWGRGWVV